MAVRSSSGRSIRILLGMPAFPGAVFLGHVKSLDLYFGLSTTDGPSPEQYALWYLPCMD